MEKTNETFDINIFNFLTFGWITPFIFSGFRKELTGRDIPPPQNSYKNENIYPKFEKKFKKNRNIILSLHSCYWKSFWFINFLVFINNMMYMSQAIFQRKIIKHLTQGEYYNSFYWTLSLFCFNIIEFFMYQVYIFLKTGLDLKIKSIVTREVYKKLVKTRFEKNFGEIVSLVANHCEKFAHGLSEIYYLWSLFFQILYVIVMCFVFIGKFAFISLIFMVVFIPTQILFSRIFTKIKWKIGFYYDKRIKLLNEIFSSLKNIKFLSWERFFERKLINIRKDEIKMTFLYYIVKSFSLFVLVIPLIIIIITFSVIFFVEREFFTVDVVFPIITFISLLEKPLKYFSSVLSNLSNSYVSYSRIKKYLDTEEINPNERKSSDENKEFPIILRNFSGCYGDSNSLNLRNINLKIKRGKRIMICGKVGSGKSSLLSAIVGEMKRIEGEILVSRENINYCPQVPFIINDSIRNNIIFHSTFNRKRLKFILRLTDLKREIYALNDGLYTEIGEHGKNLSGGQISRVSLARALYNDNNANIYLIDSAFSSLDSNVGKKLFENVILNYLKDKTVIMVTHKIEWLKFSDEIIIMDDGRIQKVGKYENLLSEGYLESLKEQKVAKLRQRRIQTDLNRILLTSDRQSVREMEISGKKEEVKFVVVWEYVKYLSLFYHPIFAIILLIFLFLLMLVTVICGSSTGLWLNIITSAGGKLKFFQNYFESLFVSTFVEPANMSFIFYAALGLITCFLIFVSSFIFYFISLFGSYRIHNKTFRSILYGSCSFIDNTPVGQIISRFTRDVNKLDGQMPIQIFIFYRSLIIFFEGFVINTLITEGIYTIPAILIIVLFIGMEEFYRRTSRDLNRLSMVYSTPLHNHFYETKAGISSIKTFKKLQKYNQTNINLINDDTKVQFALFSSRRWLQIRLSILGAIIIFFSTSMVIVLSYYNVMDPSFSGALLSYSVFMCFKLSNIVFSFCEIDMCMKSVERMIYYPRIIDPEESGVKFLKRKWPMRGNIKFENYHMKYGPGNKYALKDINISVKAREHIGIVGRTGSGKSSIGASILREIGKENVTGKIIIDNLDISKLDPRFVRSKIAIITQAPFLFEGTIRSNMDPFCKYTDEEIWSALESSYMKNKFSKLEYGLNYKVDQGGMNFSIGERQLLSLSRAILRKKKIIILDECTASVDAEHDQLIQNTIKSRFNNCTCLIIAHRISTIINCNKILVIDRGNVVEFDTPYNLLQKKKYVFFKKLIKNSENFKNNIEEILIKLKTGEKIE